MNRREFLALSSTAGLGMLATSQTLGPRSAWAADGAKADQPRLLPYPQEFASLAGALHLGTPEFLTAGASSRTKEIAMACLRRFLPRAKGKLIVRLGSLEEGYDRAWLNEEEAEFLASERTSPDASVLRVTRRGIVAVGKGKWGMLWAAQTLCQMLLQAQRQGQSAIPCVRIKDWPDMRWRCLAPTLTWYSGWNRLEGYDLCNWSEGEWKWLADWSMLHKCNGWAVCMYGYWPFRLPGYEKETLDLDSYWFNPRTRQKELRRFTHRNIVREFYPEVIRYANERGVKVYAYIGKNSFNGCDLHKNPKLYAGGAAELLPFAPGVEQYWNALIGRILELGFNGFVFEDPEANHVPNQNEPCYQTFWQPWASTYGFTSIKDTDQNNPPLGVQVEYYTWLFREFDRLIQKHCRRLQRESETYLISHVLLARIMAESKNAEERQKWFNLVDQKQGKAVPFIITESNERQYVEIFGKERIASLGGRGGSCTNAMRRIASVNNNWLHGGMGGDLAYERDCQQHIFQAGGFGAMGYIFEWTNTEVFGYLAAQHLWRNRGIPGVSNENQTDILDYAYRMYYGDEVGRLVARAMDEGSDVNDAMVLEGVYGSQWPSTGRALHRDYQFLTVLADHGERLAREACRKFTGHEPDLEQPAYDQDAFSWDGYDAARDRLFKTERLRRLWLSCRRSQEMCRTALAHRRAQQLIKQGAAIGEVLAQYDRALEHARRNQFIYQINYDDDYDWTDGLCAKVTERLEQQRADFLAACSGGSDLRRRVPDAARSRAENPVVFLPWEPQEDILPERGKGRGLFLSTRIGFVDQEDYFRLGVVFTVEAPDAAGAWKPIFRRGLMRRTRGWEQWDIPLDAVAGPRAGPLRLRLVTDSYTRAQDRNAPTWKWALWGQPQLIRKGGMGKREVIYDFAQRLDEARALKRLDEDGLERPFDAPGEDATGATFKLLGPDATGRRLLQVQQENTDLQWVGGFRQWAPGAPHQAPYTSYLGEVDSGWSYAAEAPVTWETDPAPSGRPTAILFVGSTDFNPAKAELRCNQEPVITFETGIAEDRTWRREQYELRYLHVANIPNRGLSGIYILRLPASSITPRQPLRLAMSIPAKGGGWVMCHGYPNTLQAVQGQLRTPEPSVPAIAAFTPHKDGRHGVTIGEFTIRVD
ncbi:MAG TPA: glycoside hydrolase family 20 zincin-like fold domain-containing protein [Candidatus Acidoferrum sp.]|nr:glycoside hydrolase family 20 zincin-like fold domain-containing protein [Candidatus Acidoferrum sp.]